MADSPRRHDLRHLNFLAAPAVRRGRGLASHVPTHPPDDFPADPEPPETHEPPDEFIAWLLERAGLDPDAYRANPFKRRLPACLRALRANSPDHARALIEEKPPLLSVAMESILLGVTEFFRDPPVFETIRRLLPSPSALGRPLRVWSAGCSDGSELYSIAMLLAEAELLPLVHLLGTDCREDAINAARAASYAAPALERLGPLLRDRYFIARNARYNVVNRLRWHTRFEVEDILRRGNPGPWDLILWRNSAIYLKSAAARRIWQYLADSLRPGGLLVTGKAEHPDCDVQLRRLAPCVYLKEPQSA